MEPDFHEAKVRYLGFLAVVCLLASIHAGPGVLLVWLLTAIALRWMGQRPSPDGSKSPPSSRQRRKRR